MQIVNQQEPERALALTQQLTHNKPREIPTETYLQSFPAPLQRNKNRLKKRMNTRNVKHLEIKHIKT